MQFSVSCCHALQPNATLHHTNLYTRRHPFAAPHRVATVALQLDDRAQIQHACSACMDEIHACISQTRLSKQGKLIKAQNTLVLQREDMKQKSPDMLRE